MDHIALLERPPEEVSAVAPPPRRSGRFTGVAVLAAIAAAVLGISALGSVTSTNTGAADLAANAAAAQGTAPAGAQPAAPAGHNAAGHQAAGPGGAAPAGGAPAVGNLTIQMVMLKFQPQALDVAVGDTVTWVNNDTASHTVTVTDGPEKFDSGLLAPGKSFSHKFTMPGVYSYYCAVHPDMTGKVTVAAAGAAVPPPGAAVPPPGDVMAPPAGGGATCAPSAALDALFQHIKAAHLQESPSQQAADLLSLDQYVKTHTVLAQNMLAPLLDGVVTNVSATSLDALWMHVKAAHL
ncbi:MAG TPA: cupredoxin family copper-binding protein, partial [Pseudonocardiaceae bacterium]